jgi:hypothetical protein
MMAPTPAAEKSDATWRAYRSDFDHFATWCNNAGRTPQPASVERWWPIWPLSRIAA